MYQLSADAFAGFFKEFCHIISGQTFRRMGIFVLSRKLDICSWAPIFFFSKIENVASW